jgi:hypothetical protein
MKIPIPGSGNWCGDDDDGEAFLARMKEIHAELAELNESASELAARIHLAFSSWGE